MSTSFRPGINAFESWFESLVQGTQPILYQVGDSSWSGVEIGPGNITLVGGAPGAGKTALMTQLTFEAVLRNAGLRALIANVEMSPSTLFDRQLARLACVDATDVRFRRLSTDTPGVAVGIETIAGAAERIAFMQPPFNMNNLARSAAAFKAELLVIDYIQRFTIEGDPGGLRESMGAMMSLLREMAEAGASIVAVSAVARGRGEHGSSYNRQSLGLASFRESSELEYGADSAWILARDKEGLFFTCVKNRHGETPDLPLAFDAQRQTFSVATLPATQSSSSAPTQRLRKPSRKELRDKASSLRHDCENGEPGSLEAGAA